MIRNLGVWITGLIAGFIIGAMIGAYLFHYDEDMGVFFGGLGGMFLFACLRLWLGQRRPKL